MLTQTLKSVLSRPLLGLPPGFALGGAALLLIGGLFAALKLDGMSRGHGPVDAERGALESASAPVFAQPTTGIIRSSKADETSPWIKHAADFPAYDPAPRLAIVVVDEGADVGAARNALKLSAPVTLAIAPTADSAEKTAMAARNAGREVLLLLPMQSDSHFDTTPNPVAINVPRPELIRRVNWNLAQIDGYVGVMNGAGGEVTRDPQTMRTVLEIIDDEGLAFIDAREHPDSIAGAVARRMAIPAGDRTVEVKPGADAADLGADLASAVIHAEKWGSAIVTIPAERRLVTALQQWLTTPQPKVKIAPVSAVIQRLRSGQS